jgi:hypothetical protein
VEGMKVRPEKKKKKKKTTAKRTRTKSKKVQRTRMRTRRRRRRRGTSGCLRLALCFPTWPFCRGETSARSGSGA